MITEVAFARIIHDAWSTTLGFQTESPVTGEYSTAGALTVCVKIAGAWDGELRLHCSPQLARSIAAAIFQVETESTRSEEMFDALSELTHIIGGNLKPLLPRPVKLSLPSLPDPADCGRTTPQWQMGCCLRFLCEGHPFIVTLVGDSPAATPRENSADGQTRLSADNA